MRIGIDGRFLTHPQRGGFKTYTENLVAALARSDPTDDYVLYVDRVATPNSQLPPQARFQVAVIPGASSWVGMPWREQLGLPRRAVADGLDLLHSPCNTAPLRLACPSVVTLHDTAWLNRVTNAGWSTKRRLIESYARYVARFAARNAAAILTVSHASQERIVRRLGVPAQRVHVSYPAPSTIYRPIDQREMRTARERYRLGSDVILAIGSTDSRKNLSTLLHAYASLPVRMRERYQLAIVWTHPVLAPRVVAEATRLGIAGRTHFLLGVPDEDLVALYNGAALFVFPSLEEGFGLPPLEAMACGTPVVAANASSIPEVVGDAAELFAAQDAAGLAAAIERVLCDDARQATLIDRGLKRAAGFSWMRCATETVAVYRKAGRNEDSAAHSGAPVSAR